MKRGRPKIDDGPVVLLARHLARAIKSRPAIKAAMQVLGLRDGFERIRKKVADTKIVRGLTLTRVGQWGMRLPPASAKATAKMSMTVIRSDGSKETRGDPLD